MTETNGFLLRAWLFLAIGSNATHGVFTLLGGHDFLIFGQALLWTPGEIFFLVAFLASFQTWILGGLGGMGVWLIWWSVLRRYVEWLEWYSDTCHRLDCRYGRPMAMGSFDEYSQVLAASILGPLIWWSGEAFRG